MIYEQTDASAQFHDRLIHLAGYDALVGPIQDLCRAVAQTAIDPDFPGALIPVASGSGEILVYAATHSPASWRRLNPILIAFAGPTLTSYTGIPSELPQIGPVETLIRQARPSTVGILSLPSDLQSQASALRALARARDTLARAPDMQRKAPEPTSWLLASFQDFLNVGRRGPASDVLVRLREELRIDALNLRFLEIQLFATFGEWSAIIELPGFSSLCVARRPPAVTALMLEALYRAHIDASFAIEDSAATKSRYLELCRPLAQPMLTVPTPATLTPGGWRIYALEAWVSPERRDLFEVVADRHSDIAWLTESLATRRQSADSERVPPAASPLNKARRALAEVSTVDSIDAVSMALASIDKLSNSDLARLSEAEPFRSLFRVVADAGASGGLPASWPEWLAKAADPAFTNALDVARQGKDEWPIDETAGDPIVIRNFVSALEQAQGDAIASERTANALPFMVAWLKRDPGFPRDAMGVIYSNFLTLFAMGAARGRSIYESSQLLIHALLETGLTEKGYHDVIADTEELAGSGVGVEIVYWLLEIIEEFLRFSSPDAAAREAFLHNVLSKIVPIYSRLSSLQRAAITGLAEQLGWTLDTFGLSNANVPFDDFALKLHGKRISIYSLTESSSRQAKTALQRAVPSAIVDCNADHVGTARLRALAENADLFVLTSLSAKHAATDFIRERRANRPLIYAQGRGFSSILRAIEDHLKTSRA